MTGTTADEHDQDRRIPQFNQSAWPQVSIIQDNVDDVDCPTDSVFLNRKAQSTKICKVPCGTL